MHCATYRRTEAEIDKVRDKEEMKCIEGSYATNRRTEAKIDKVRDKEEMECFENTCVLAAPLALKNPEIGESHKSPSGAIMFYIISERTSSLLAPLAASPPLGCATDRRKEAQIDKVRNNEAIECNKA